MNFYVDVILPIPIDQLFCYEITESEFDFIKPGSRVSVPFGKSRIITGVVFNSHNERPLSYDVKHIHQIIDEIPIVNENQLSFWDWMSKYYMCGIGEVMKASIPSVLLIESETIISLNKKTEFNHNEFSDDEFLIYEALLKGLELTIHEISEILNKKNVFKIIQSLNDKHIIQIDEKLYSKYKPKLKRFVEINILNKDTFSVSEIKEKLKRSPKQLYLFVNLLKLNLREFISVDDLKKKFDVSSSLIKNLIDKDILKEHFIEINRFNNTVSTVIPINKLSQSQEKAYKKIQLSFKKNNPVLFHGVTSSGKTEVYVKLIQDALIQKNQILYLVPEIALTTQVVRRLTNFFGDKVLVYHSGYSINQRVEVWNKISTNKSCQLIVGARSSLLMPFKSLKLIIVDEEHEQSYKQQEPAPRYHARDASLVLSRIFNSNILLGSATPSVESYNNAVVLNKYDLVELKKRYNDVLMPVIELIDLKMKYAKKLMNGHFSDSLVNEIFNTVSNHKQVILYQNRRGFSPIVECEDCGTSPTCINCDVSLTYHLNTNSLKCHYCGFGIPLINKCSSCHSNNIITVGFGTEQVEEEVKAIFPNYRVKRLDYDTTRKKNSFEKLISDFENQKIDILIGTQMITKGLDFKNVKLVGILNADNSLNFPDFRAYERSFQLIQQVSGRAGRSSERGKVCVQTYNPKHKILQNIINDDYISMFEEEISDRVKYNYPPNCKLIKITLKHKDYSIINESSDWLGKYLRQFFKKNILGPEFPHVIRVRNKFQKNILIKIQKNKSLNQTKSIIIKSKKSLSSIAKFKSVQIIINVDSY